jgi:hypothetical protein
MKASSSSARPARARRGEQRGADDHPDRVGRDEVARGGHRDRQVGRDLRQQAHDRELGQADRECPKGHGEDCGTHSVNGRPVIESNRWVVGVALVAPCAGHRAHRATREISGVARR